MIEVWRTNEPQGSMCSPVNWNNSEKPPKYVLFHDKDRGDHFIGTYRLGAWMEIDIQRLASILNVVDK
jgi:hypothetical protein